MLTHTVSASHSTRVYLERIDIQHFIKHTEGLSKLFDRYGDVIVTSQQTSCYIETASNCIGHSFWGKEKPDRGYDTVNPLSPNHNTVRELCGHYRAGPCQFLRAYSSQLVKTKNVTRRVRYPKSNFGLSLVFRSHYVM